MTTKVTSGVLDINSATEDTAPVGSTDYLLTHDASASTVKKILLHRTTAFKVVTFTRDVTIASGNQAVTGVGFVPKAVVFLGGRTTGSGYASIGVDDGTTRGCVFNNHNSTADTWGAEGGTTGTSHSIVFIESGTATYEGFITSLDSDGFTIAWTKTGSPTGTAFITALAIR